MLSQTEFLIAALLLVLAVAYLYRRTGYRFLGFGSVALLAATALHLLDPLPVSLELGLLASIAVMLAGVMADAVSEPYPARTMLALATLYLLLVFVDVPLAWPLLVTGLMFGVVVLLVRFRPNVATVCLGLTILLFVAGIGLQAGGMLDWSDRLVRGVLPPLLGICLALLLAERSLFETQRRDRTISLVAEHQNRLEAQFTQVQKLESLGLLAGGIAHDFNNMLTSILGYASLAVKKLPADSEVRKDLYMVMSGARQAVELTSQMLVYAGKGSIEFVALDISRVYTGMKGLVHSIVPAKVNFTEQLAEGLPAMRGDASQLGQVIMNLIANAVDALRDEPGSIVVTTGLLDLDETRLRSCFFAEDKEPGAYLYLRVQDSGVGISGEQMARIFDPFYSDRETRRGLGLASLSGIVRQHQGVISVESTPGFGTEFTVCFPAVAVVDSDPLVPTPELSAGQTAPRILVADDDSRIRSLLASVLAPLQADLTFTEDGRETLDLLERQGRGGFDLLVLDCTMPKLSGTEVYQQLRRGGSSVPVVLMSGYQEGQVSRHIQNDPGATFVKKPFSVDEFLDIVRASLAQATRSSPTV
ncbi:MAG: ATP-binding protein [Pseudomonadota bacterium]